jgi:flagellar M-ring protein FliF
MPLIATLQRHSRILAMGAVGLIVLAFFGWLILGRAAAPDRVLFGGVGGADLAAMGRVLEGAAIRYKIAPDGTTILVGEDDLGRARMLVAGQGLPTAGAAGYELMDRGPALGSTQFRDDITYLRALEGELARTIGALSGVRQAKVHIVLAKREPFARDWTPPSASVLLTTQGVGVLGREQVAAIRQLVAASVARLKPESVSVVDHAGNLLARTENGGASQLDRSDERRVALEERLARAIEEQLAPIVGAGRVRAKVTAELDLSSRRDVEESFDPLGQVQRSEQRETEQERSDESRPNVSIERDLPETAEAPPGAGRRTERQREKATTNFEIGKTTREHVVAAGEVRRLSISIAVDGICEAGADGRPACRPRTPEELAHLERLARATAGFDAERGDAFEIASVPFAALPPPAVADADPAEADLASLLGRHALPLGAGAIALGLALAGLGFALRRARRREKAAEVRALEAEAETQRSVAALAAAPAGEPAAVAAPGTTAIVPAEAPEPMVDLGRKVQGNVRAATVQRMREAIEANLDESVTLLRGWLVDGRELR